MLDLNKPWTEYTFVAFDTETSGAYPIQSDVVEFGAVKWKNGQEIDRLQFLIKPREPMSDFIIGIHGITNEMVADAALMSEKIHEVKQFFQDCIMMAHHAPFDLGFMTLEFEKAQIKLLEEPALCTSLLARKVIRGTVNHKLQTLIPHLKIEQGTAHRAYDDAKACLQVGLHVMNQIGPQATLQEILQVQEKKLFWKDYTLHNSNPDSVMRTMVDCCEQKKFADIKYLGGTIKGGIRRVRPLGIVRSPDGDFCAAECMIDRVEKRFYIKKIEEAVLVY